jgi:predicted nucleic acid-binding protein
MARRLIVDTGVLIATERGARPLSAVIEPSDDVVIAAISAAELLTRVELAGEAQREARSAFVADLLEVLPVERYDAKVAAVHARLLAHVHRTGTPRGAHDLIIAATAISTGRILVTSDRGARFSELPGLDCVEV